ncbi:HTH-type transcriptional activator Btr [Planctomycetes bacterium Pan216]|uniref:HTH-type transcriptional activator Btr n=1 Tax=Kolteria novifilia TaxID=2527975 RepID=A0A518B637_9BACT|nr:HTH-type transcriptional activator Btr [Planctomycetes bacterium Pan216]
MADKARTKKPRARRIVKATGLDVQTAFFERMGQRQQFQELFEYLPGTYFFVKDRESRMIYASRSILDRFGLSEQSEIVGTKDSDYFPTEIADAFVRDDQRVMSTGEPLINHVEIWYNDQRVFDWFVKNKLPVRDTAGCIIGVMGTVQSYEGRQKSLSMFSMVSQAVDHIRENLESPISVPELAQVVGVSQRQLHRKFREAFGMSVQEFLAKTRIQAASAALVHTSDSIVTIAHRFGFCDQSAFTHQFRKYTGETPLRYRRRHHRG